MDPRWRALVDTLAARQFADLAGARLSLTLPISDRLVTELIRARMPASGALSDLAIRAEAANQLTLRVTVARPSFLPALTVRFRIDRQPDLPSSAVLGLRLLSTGLASLAGVVTRLFQVLPPGVRLDGDRLSVDLATLARQYKADELLQCVTAMAVTTAPGQLVIDLRGALPPRTDA